MKQLTFVLLFVALSVPSSFSNPQCEKHKPKDVILDNSVRQGIPPCAEEQFNLEQKWRQLKEKESAKYDAMDRLDDIQSGIEEARSLIDDARVNIPSMLKTIRDLKKRRKMCAKEVRDIVKQLQVSSMTDLLKRLNQKHAELEDTEHELNSQRTNVSERKTEFKSEKKRLKSLKKDVRFAAMDVKVTTKEHAEAEIQVMEAQAALDDCRNSA